jgi:hypothetical protein
LAVAIAQIVTITYAALLGGLFLAMAMALAFGLGGRDVATGCSRTPTIASAATAASAATWTPNARAEGATPPTSQAPGAQCRPAPHRETAPSRTGRPSR